MKVGRSSLDSFLVFLFTSSSKGAFELWAVLSSPLATLVGVHPMRALPPDKSRKIEAAYQDSGLLGFLDEIEHRSCLEHFEVTSREAVRAFELNDKFAEVYYAENKQYKRISTADRLGQLFLEFSIDAESLQRLGNAMAEIADYPDSIDEWRRLEYASLLGLLMQLSSSVMRIECQNQELMAAVKQLWMTSALQKSLNKIKEVTSSGCSCTVTSKELRDMYLLKLHTIEVLEVLENQRMGNMDSGEE